MAEYSREQRNQLSRVLQSSQNNQVQFTDNRNTITNRRNSIIQQKLTESLSVAGDMMYYLNNCFCSDTSQAYIRFKNWKWNKFGKLPNHGDIINRIRPKIHNFPFPVNYKRLSTDLLPTKKNLLAWLRDGKSEHMWINDGGTTLKVASRNAEKLPHPTLAGGDPDVSSAGLISIDETVETDKKIIINNRSGHFKPANVDQDSVSKLETALASEDNFYVKNANP